MNFLKVAMLVVIFLLASCTREETPHRAYRMGMMNSAPRYDNFDLILQSLELWTARADAAIISTEVPWDTLITGTKARNYVARNYQELVAYYRSKGLTLWVYIDPQNGLDRAHDARPLQLRGKSIADAAMQQLYVEFVMAMDSLLKPEHLGLALETNLIRGIATPAIYNGVKTAVNTAAQELADRDTKARLSVSVQADYAWGTLGGGPYKGVAQDFIDFPFIEEVGISSYPYFGFQDPADIPDHYFARLVEGTAYPVFVSEGGWASASVNTATVSFTSSPDLQKQYILRQHQLLTRAHAIALFQLTFTDLDIANLPNDIPDNIGYFSSLGLVDINLQPKPALRAWDKLFGYALAGQ